MQPYLLALDQGTASSRAILFDPDTKHHRHGTAGADQQHPHEGWVEQNPMEIYSSQYAVMAEVLASANISAREVAAIGITNQRETTISMGETDRQTHLSCDWLAMQADCAHRAAACPPRAGTAHSAGDGLVPDAYFSARRRLHGFSTMCPMPERGQSAASFCSAP